MRRSALTQNRKHYPPFGTSRVVGAWLSSSGYQHTKVVLTRSTAPASDPPTPHVAPESQSPTPPPSSTGSPAAPSNAIPAPRSQRQPDPNLPCPPRHRIRHYSRQSNRRQ